MRGLAVYSSVTGTCRGRENVNRSQSQKLNLVKGTLRTMARPHSARTYRSQSGESCSVCRSNVPVADSGKYCSGLGQVLLL